MTAVKTQDHLYIVVSQTGTLLSRVLKLITGAQYNHVSLGLQPDLEYMYSFGGKNPYNPFYGGFVIESPKWGTFKRFSKTKVVVLSLDIGAEKHKEIAEHIEIMRQHQKEYGYNYLGLMFAYFKICRVYRNRYYCSEFVKYILQHFSVNGAEMLEPISQPIHFLSIPNIHEIYSGLLQDYEKFYKSNLQ